jgi:hypothetical protein
MSSQLFVPMDGVLASPNRATSSTAGSTPIDGRVILVDALLDEMWHPQMHQARGLLQMMAACSIASDRS